jgi:hypothetical protein
MNYPNSESLLPLIERIDKSYYDVIINLCNTAMKHALRLQELELHNVTSQYVSQCIRLIDEIKHYITIKKEHFVPYVQSLFEKQAAGHDCSSCQGGCTMRHEMQLSELRQSHVQLKDVISRVQMVSLPLYSETIYPDVYRLLRNHMALLENTLTELFSIEETRLLAKIVEAQKKINSRD